MRTATIEMDDPPRITQPTIEDKAEGQRLKPGNGSLQKETKETKVEAARGDARPSDEIVQRIQHYDLHPFSEQPRKTFDQGSMQELTDSIKANGIVTPLLVRPYLSTTARGDARPTYEIICGERRWRAAGKLSLAELPCIVRTMDDNTALLIAGMENLQRDGIPAYEEAVWIAKIISSGAETVQSLADRLGKGRSRAFIYHRLSLARVSPAVLVELQHGNIEATVAQLIGTIPDPKQQEKALEKLSPEYGGPVSFDDAKDIIEESFRKDLKGCCFDRDDGELLKAVPSCEACPKRSGNIPGYDGNNVNVCTDPGCYKRKVAAHVSRKTAKLEAQGLKVLPASEAKKMENKWDSTTFEPERAGYISEKKEVSKGKTIGDLLKGSAAQACVALDSKQHNAHVVFKAADVAPLLKAKGVTIKVPKPEERQSYNSAEATAQRNKEEAERKEKSARLHKVAEAALPQLLAVAAKKPAKTFLLWLCDTAHDYDFNRVLKAKGLNGDKLAKKSESELITLWLEFKAGQRMIYDYQGEYSRDFQGACDSYGIDLKQVEKELNAQKDVGARFVAGIKPKGKAARA